MKLNKNCWQIKTLDEVASVKTGYPFDSKLFSEVEGFPIIRIRDIKRGATSTYYKGEILQDYIIRKGDYLIGMDGEFNLAEWKSEEALLNQRTCKIIFDDQIINPKYGFYFIPKKLKEIEDSTSFATVKHISHKQILKIQIPLPPLPIQKQIAQILEKTDEAKQKRKEVNELTDEFLQSVFIEMFGDPVKNPKGWEKVKVKYLYEIKLGKMRSEKNITGKYLKPYLRNINVQWGRINLSDIKEMDFDPKEQKIYALRKGDILVCEGGEVGRTAIWSGEITEIYYQNALHRLRAKSNNIDSQYFLYFMFFAAKYGLIIRQTSTVTIAHFTAAKFNEFEVMLPPFPLQQQFAEIVNKTEALKEKQKQSEQELENLFQSLMQRAFKGELVPN